MSKWEWISKHIIDEAVSPKLIPTLRFFRELQNTICCLRKFKECFGTLLFLSSRAAKLFCCKSSSSTSFPSNVYRKWFLWTRKVKKPILPKHGLFAVMHITPYCESLGCIWKPFTTTYSSHTPGLLYLKLYQIKVLIHICHIVRPNLPQLAMNILEKLAIPAMGFVMVRMGTLISVLQYFHSGIILT